MTEAPTEGLHERGPLTGVRVLDLTHVLNGPFCTMLLAHMGADVIKVEHGDGDRYRHSWMPVDADRDGYESLVVNANKRCITLNLKCEEGKEMFERLVAQSDVLAENFGVGTLERLGYTYERLHDINHRLVYASSRAYGNTGPYAEENIPAFANTIMAVSGWTHSGWTTPDAVGSRSLGIGDEAAGVSMALGICAALVARSATGQGQEVSISMQEAQLGFMVSSLHTLFEGQQVSGPPVRCADGFVSFHMPDLDDQRWRTFCEKLGHEEAAEDPRFLTVTDRRAHFDELMQTVESWLRNLTRVELWRLFRAYRIPSAPVLSLDEAVEDAHLAARGAFVDVEHPEAGTLRMLRPWIRFNGSDTPIRHAGPSIGEHNYEVYGELLGLSSDEVDQLAERGVI